MDPIRLAPGLELPAEDLLESAIAIIAKRGRGKSGAVKVLMEELTRVGLPFVALDPVGILWGIRSSFDGTGPGLPVLVIGGEHKDVPLNRKNGAAVAQRIVHENISAVIDFSEEPKAAYREFVRDFAHELFRINNTPRMVILEEAPELVPQRVMGDRAETFEAVERIVSRGRNKGLGVVLVSQRAATLNKDVLTQVDVLVVLGLAAPQDRKALGEWIRARDVENQAETFDRGLAGLHRQEAWVWSPEAFGGLFLKIKFRDFKTFHPDQTHLRRMGWLKVRAVTADVAGVVARFEGHKSKSTGEKDVEEKERKAYEAKIRTLEDQLEVLKDRLRQQDRAEVAGSREAHPAAPRVDPHDVVVSHELPSLIAVHKLPTVETNTGEMVGRIALLVSEDFFDGGTKRQADVGHEFVRRGFGANFSSGGLSVRLSEAMAKMTVWGFFRKEESGYSLVPGVKQRVRVVEERA